MTTAEAIKQGRAECMLLCEATAAEYRTSIMASMAESIWGEAIALEIAKRIRALPEPRV